MSVLVLCNGSPQRHHNADKTVTNAALASQHKIGFNTMRRLLTVHGIDRNQTVKIKNMPRLMQNPHIAAAVTNRLARHDQTGL